MSYGRTAPAGIPQPIWDDAIDLWLNLSTADSDDIKTIADRLLIGGEAIACLKAHVEYEAMPRDRGGKHGPRGRAWTAFVKSRDATIAKAECRS